MKENEVKAITEKLENGVREVFESDGYKAFLDCMGKFYHYSANNTMLIYLQCPTASLVAGYKAWNEKFSRHVKKGETAIKILAPCPHKKEQEVVNADGTKETKEIQFTTYRPVNVFDISQTDGKPLPESPCKALTGTVEGFSDTFERVKAFAPCPIGFEEINDGANGYYSLAEKRIAIKSGLSEEQTLKTAIHEIAHALLHDRDTGTEKETDRATKEVQAESVAYTVCAYYGLDTSDYSFGYVAGWSKDKEAKELAASMEVIRKTAKEIIEGIAA